MKKMKRERKKEKNKMINLSDNQLRLIKAVLIIIAVISFGVLAVNQALGYFYKAQLLKTPCDLCLELNPEKEVCFKMNIIKTNYSKTYYNITIP